MPKSVREERLAKLRGVYVIADDAPHWPHTMECVVEAALRGGATAVQLRIKHLRDGDALQRARSLTARAQAGGALVFVNDRSDIADLCGADGVHLGDRDLAAERLPEELRARLLVGASTHTLEQVSAAQHWPVDYIGFGPVFETGSKRSEHPPRELPMLRQAVERSARPVVAIGGIDASSIASVLGSGVAAAAVISAVQGAPDPEAALRELAGAR